MWLLFLPSGVCEGSLSLGTLPLSSPFQFGTHRCLINVPEIKVKGAAPWRVPRVERERSPGVPWFCSPTRWSPGLAGSPGGGLAGGAWAGAGAAGRRGRGRGGRGGGGGGGGGGGRGRRRGRSPSPRRRERSWSSRGRRWVPSATARAAPRASAAPARPPAAGRQ
jgi:hypothetical protein